jgi:hypothetical protein
MIHRRLAALVLLIGCSHDHEHDAARPPPAPHRLAVVRGSAGHADPVLTPEEGTLAVVRAGGSVHVRVVPGPGYHMNDEYPSKLSLEPTPGVTIAAATATIAEQELAIAIPYQTTSPGAHAIRGQLDLAVCERDRCLPRSMPIAVEVN